MSNTTLNRFHVGDGVCGLLGAFRSYALARTFATSYRSTYPAVTIYDSMARKGARQEWAWSDEFNDFIAIGWNKEVSKP
jgi:hypothetical protein